MEDQRTALLRCLREAASGATLAKQMGASEQLHEHHRRSAHLDHNQASNYPLEPVQHRQICDDSLSRSHLRLLRLVEQSKQVNGNQIDCQISSKPNNPQAASRKLQNNLNQGNLCVSTFHNQSYQRQQQQQQFNGDHNQVYSEILTKPQAASNYTSSSRSNSIQQLVIQVNQQAARVDSARSSSSSRKNSYFSDQEQVQILASETNGERWPATNDHREPYCPTSKQANQTSSLQSSSGDDSTQSSGYVSVSVQGAKSSSCESPSKNSSRSISAINYYLNGGDELADQEEGEAEEEELPREYDLKSIPEMGQTSLCLDEFSSFIEGTVTPSQNNGAIRNGARLQVGARHEPDSASAVVFGQHVRDNEQGGRPRSLQSLGSAKLSGSGDSLDLYLKRVQSLIRLSRGELGVSMEDAFNGAHNDADDDDDDKENGQSAGSRVQYEPLDRDDLPKTRVVQELQICEDDEEDDSKSSKLISLKQIETCENYRSILSTEQIVPDLNWDSVLNCDDDDDLRELAGDISQEKQARLEESYCNKLAKLINNTPNRRSCDIREMRAQVGQFCQQYVNYQRKMRRECPHSSDWHSNWLFGSPNINTTSNEGEREETTSSGDELLQYSTLLQSQSKRVKLNYLGTRESERLYEPIERLYALTENWDVIAGANNRRRVIDVCQMLILDDFQEAADELEDEVSRSKKKRRQRRNLEVAYESTSAHSDLLLSRSSHCKHELRFAAFGHLFDCKLPNQIASSGDNFSEISFKEKILSKFGEIIQNSKRPISIRNCGSHKDHLEINNNNYYQDDDEDQSLSSSQIDFDSVRFDIELGDVELVNRLPVIQVCAKVSGSLPIKVSWLRQKGVSNGTANDRAHDDEFEEISDIFKHNQTTSNRTNKRLKIRRIDLGPSGGNENCNWPVGMRANYDFEYESEWSSWYRFKRNQAEIMFELRQPSEENDFDRCYKCVIENYCSRQESVFKICMRKLESATNLQQGGPKQRLALKRKNQTQAGRAILRTWSQRTLHRPPTTNLEQEELAGKTSKLGDTDLAESKRISDKVAQQHRQPIDNHDVPMNNNEQLGSNYCSLGTLSRKRALELADINGQSGDSNCHLNLGKDFPYHPENLLKRLQQQKFGTLSSKKQFDSLNHSSGSLANPTAMEKSYELELGDQLELRASDEDEDDDHDFIEEQKENVQNCHSNDGIDNKMDAKEVIVSKNDRYQQVRTSNQSHSGLTQAPVQESAGKLELLSENLIIKNQTKSESTNQEGHNKDNISPSARLASQQYEKDVNAIDNKPLSPLSSPRSPHSTTTFAQTTSSTKPVLPSKPKLAVIYNQQQQQQQLKQNHHPMQTDKTLGNQQQTTPISHNPKAQRKLEELNYDHDFEKSDNQHHNNLSALASASLLTSPGISSVQDSVAPKRANVKSLISRFSMA